MARLARLVGRGRTAEILLGADDFPGFVETFARRIAGFDKAALAGTKALLDPRVMAASRDLSAFRSQSAMK